MFKLQNPSYVPSDRPLSFEIFSKVPTDYSLYHDPLWLVPLSKDYEKEVRDYKYMYHL